MVVVVAVEKAQHPYERKTISSAPHTSNKLFLPDRVKHIGERHPEKMCWPTQEDYQNRLKPNRDEENHIRNDN